MLLLSMCENPSILKIIYYVKILITAIQYLVPILLIVYISLDCAKGVANGSAPADILATSKNRIIAAIIIFCVPVVVNVILNVSSNFTTYGLCWDNAELSLIKQYEQEYREREQQRIEDELKRQEEEKEKQEEENKLNDEYTNANSHTNSINGVKYKLYNQADSRWGSVKYPSGKTIADIGCLITSVAVVSSAADSSITPKTVFDNGARHQYPYTGVVHTAGSDAFTCKTGSISRSNIIAELNKGNVVVIMVKEASVFTGSQHYMALIDISKNGSQIFVGNSYGSGTGSYSRNGWFDTNTVLTDVREFNICTPSEKLISKFN